MLRTSFICFMMNNEVISLEEKIMLLINGKMDQNSYDECQSTQLSKELKLSRNQVIRLLNELLMRKNLLKLKQVLSYIFQELLLKVNIRRNFRQMNTNHWMNWKLN